LRAATTPELRQHLIEEPLSIIDVKKQIGENRVESVMLPVFSAAAGVMLGATAAALWAALPAMPRIISTLHWVPERAMRTDTGEFWGPLSIAAPGIDCIRRIGAWGGGRQMKTGRKNHKRLEGCRACSHLQQQSGL
jgi:hypothetical protein